MPSAVIVEGSSLKRGVAEVRQAHRHVDANHSASPGMLDTSFLGRFGFGCVGDCWGMCAGG